jgi:hypothetical protein
MNKLAFVSLFFLLTNQLLLSQNDFKPGYIITVNNTKIEGEINFLYKFESYKYCYFRKSKNDSIKYFTPYEIGGYFVNNCLYKSKSIQIDSLNFQQLFLEVLIEGKISLYSYFLKNYKEKIYIENDALGRIELPYTEIDKRVLQRIVKFTTDNHQRILKQYMADCPEIFPQIDNIKKPERIPLIKLIKKYHEILFGNLNQVKHIKKKEPTHFNILPSYQLLRINNSVSIKKNIHFCGSSFTYKDLFSKYFYFKIGFYYGKIDNYNFYQIPIQLLYLYPKYKLKPYFGLCSFTTFGTVNTTNDINNIMTYGLLYDINKNLGIFSEYQIDPIRSNISGLQLGISINMF